MRFTMPDMSVTNIQNEPVRPTKSAGELQVLFDKTGSDTKSYLETHIDQLEAEFDRVEGNTKTWQNLIALKTLWTLDTSLDSYCYKVDVDTGVLSDGWIYTVIFSQSDAVDGNFSPIVTSHNTGFTLYAKDLPQTDITIPTVIGIRYTEGEGI